MGRIERASNRTNKHQRNNNDDDNDNNNNSSTFPLLCSHCELLPNAMQASSRPSAKTKPSGWTGPSHLSIFIRNLKLVHLDEREDWPDINLRTFSNSTQQNQRQRIKCVEWALYYLFTIWDPETANNVR